LHTNIMLAIVTVRGDVAWMGDFGPSGLR
jgi:hypothetical protein